MAEFDEGMEKRVWQRVRGEAQPEPLQALAAGERASAAVYLRLSRLAQGHGKVLLRQLYARERQHGNCLNGISLLRDGRALSVRTVPPEEDSRELALRKCYARALRAAGEYERQSSDGEYGHVFAHMARQEREHCRMILELLGEMGR